MICKNTFIFFQSQVLLLINHILETTRGLIQRNLAQTFQIVNRQNITFVLTLVPPYFVSYY